MTKQETLDFIARHYNTYINQTIYFEANGLMARVKAIEPVEGDHENFMAYCYLENPDESDPSFKDHIYSHLELQDVIKLAKIVK